MEFVHECQFALLQTGQGDSADKASVFYSRDDRFEPRLG
jgi:hypothetical protein